MPKEVNLRTMPSAIDTGSMAKDVSQTSLLNVVAHETPDTVTDDNPSKEYVTGSGKPPAPLGAKGRLG